MNKKAPQGDAPLDLLYAELVRATGSDKENSILDICISGKQKEIASVPLRYRLIALGFVKKLSPEEVNDRLLENGCPRLYARSYWEASVIYALRKGLSYVQWKDLLAQCDKQREKIVSNNKAFPRKSISLADIRTYVNDNSLQIADFNSTMHMTREIEKELAALASGNEGGQDSGQAEFLEFLRSNIESFSTVREKARYYFCKYLLYDLERRKRAYLDYMEKEIARKKARNGKNTAGFPSDPVLIQDLHVFHSLSSLERKQRTMEEADEILENAFLSMRKIYKSYSNFYFDYPFRNWKMILAENGTDPLALDPDQKKALADAVRREKIRKSQNMFQMQTCLRGCRKNSRILRTRSRRIKCRRIRGRRKKRLPINPAGRGNISCARSSAGPWILTGPPCSPSSCISELQPCLKSPRPTA